MRLFFHKHPLLTFVLAVCIFSAAKAAFSPVFEGGEQHTAQAEIRQTISAIAAFAEAEGLDAHGRSVAVRLGPD